MVQAVDFGPACPQPNKYTGATKGVRDVHEDCLYLNVYTPKVSIISIIIIIIESNYLNVTIFCLISSLFKLKINRKTAR